MIYVKTKMSKIPEKCDDCDFMHDCYETARIYCEAIRDVDYEIFDERLRKPNCPLVERPSAILEHDDWIIATLLAYIKQNTEDVCALCKNNVPCSREQCDGYMQGVGGWLDGKRVSDFRWTCMDFDFGTCPKMENTPCNGCFENDFDGFVLDFGKL